MEMNRHSADHDQSAAAFLTRLSPSAASSRKVTVPFAKYAVISWYFSLIAFSYYLAAQLGLRFRFHNSQIGVVWPANAIFLSALVLTPRTRWWLVLAATAVAHSAAMAPLV